jgi:16S rRNA (cytosine1402-N4)-methyltransferase
MDDQGLEASLSHYPVLYHEIIHALQPKREGFYIDATLGAGGHAWGLLDVSSPSGRLLGIDIDPLALELARERLAPFGERVAIVQASYVSLSEIHVRFGLPAIDGILIDLGVSSMQLDTAERGFSFRMDGPLDMRFDPDSDVRAVDLVNNLTEAELARVLTDYGEERAARQIARAIVKARPVNTTFELAEIIARSSTTSRQMSTNRRRSKQRRIHPATRSFQALRIAVNKELEALESFLPQAVQVLAAGGRLAVISYHSLEDRIVKSYFRSMSRECICPPRQPICTCDHRRSIVEINRRPIRPGAKELSQNPRSRSALLRVVEKLGDPI